MEHAYVNIQLKYYASLSDDIDSVIRSETLAARMESQVLRRVLEFF
jgi:hypothetical protein